MNREEFEDKYAQKYMGLSFVHNPTEAIESIKELRDGEGYSDHHIDLCWKVQLLKNIENVDLSGLIDLDNQLFNMAW